MKKLAIVPLALALTFSPLTFANGNSNGNGNGNGNGYGGAAGPGPAQAFGTATKCYFKNGDVKHIPRFMCFTLGGKYNY